METFAIAFVIAAAIATLSTPVVRRLAMRLGAVARGGGRHIHRRATPPLGGLAIVVALATPLLLLHLTHAEINALFTREWSRMLALALGTGAMCLLGLVDDTRGLGAATKLTCQVLVASAAYAAGLRIDALTVPLHGDLAIGGFAGPVTVIWIVAVVNAINLIDGLDGLAAGVVFFAGVTNFTVGLLTGNWWAALVMAAVMGAVLGFLIHNFNPAQIFMGDSGSYALGFVLAATSLVGSSQKSSTAVALIVPIVALGVPMFDTLLTMVRRTLARRPILEADRGHIHHRLLDLGLTQRRAVLLLYACSIAFTIAAIGIHLGRQWQVGLSLLVVCIVFGGILMLLGRRSRPATRRPASAEQLRRHMPELARRLARAGYEAEVLDALGWVARELDLVLLELVDGDGRVLLEHHASGRGVPASFHVDTLRLRVALPHEIPPETEILLQLTADLVVTHLTLVRRADPPARRNRHSPPTAVAAVGPALNAD